jgi:hypothetical protein
LDLIADIAQQNTQANAQGSREVPKGWQDCKHRRYADGSTVADGAPAKDDACD